MVLDLDLFRSDKGGNPDLVRENQKKRFKDVALVETVIAKDTEWRQCRHRADNLNKVKNVCSKVIGEKMKKKEPVGAMSEDLPADVTKDLTEIVAETLQPLTVNQIKQLRVLIDDAMTENQKSLELAEQTRNTSLREVGNHLHESVPVSNDEDENRVERTFGDCESAASTRMWTSS
ncbi:GD22783 [Drosophila simulans]|uniref:GD22783 n=1 Tax=Drosophila simulans TaxID=7240 RepID=B4Q922_DROSI|nr:GD22783 [Drosophila simulans]